MSKSLPALISLYSFVADSTLSNIVMLPLIRKALREAIVLGELQHPNIVRYYTSWIEDSNYKHPRGEDSSTSQWVILPLQLGSTVNNIRQATGG